MKYLNSVYLVGMVAGIIKFSETSQGLKVANFILSYVDKKKESEVKCFIPCVAWGTKAEIVEKIDISKQVFIHGSIKTSTYVSKVDNQEKQVLEVVVETIL